MAATQSTKRRHRSQPKAQHIYYSLRKDGSKSWEVRLPVNERGERLYETQPRGSSLDDAKARAREAHGITAPRVNSVAVTLGDIVKDWQERRNNRARTIENYDCIVGKHFGHLLNKRVRDIDRSVIESWLRSLKRQDGRPGELAEGSKNKILAVLIVVLNHARMEGLIGSVPLIEKSKRPRVSHNRERVLSPEEEKRLLFYIDASQFKWLGPIVEVALQQGLRASEVLGLRWQDIDFAGDTLHVRGALGRDRSFGPTKSGKPRSIVLMPRAKEVLLDLKMDAADTTEVGEASEYVFPNPLGRARILGNVQKRFTQAVERAGIEPTETGKITFHSLRHTAATRLANTRSGEFHIQDVMQFLGHASLDQTMAYVHHIEPTVAKRDAMAAAMAGVA